MTEPQFCPIAQKWCTCKTRCEDLLAVRRYADEMMRREIEERYEGRVEHDMDTRGNPL